MSIIEKGRLSTDCRVHFLSTVLLLVVLLFVTTTMHAQTTATLSGTVLDSSGGVISGAQITLRNSDTLTARTSETNGVGFYSIPAVQPGTYTMKIVAKGFASKERTGIIVHGGDELMLPSFVLEVGSVTATVTVEESTQIIPVDNGEKSEILESKDIDNLALEGRDTTELLKTLTGVTVSPNGLSNGSSYSDINLSENSSAVGNGMAVGGAPYRGGSALLLDNVSIIDPGENGGALTFIDPDMTAEVNVQTSNFGAQEEFGPVVISAISKSGGAHFHGTAYFNARNDVLDANDWQDNHEGVGKAGAHYYYPGGSFGGTVPHTQHKLFFWAGYEKLIQNQGNANHLTSYIPSPEMMKGDFSSDNADNAALCPNGFSSSFSGTWCNDITSTMILPDGSKPIPAAGNGMTGATIPSSFLDSGAKALAAIWPTANVNPLTTPGNYNYYGPVTNINNGWIYRLRIDYNLSDNSKFFISYQQGYSAELAAGNGAHIYWTPGNSIPMPGGGLYGKAYSKAISGHFVHTFNASSTNEFIASWAYGNFPYSPPNISAMYKTTLGYPSSYGTVFSGGSKYIPSYASGGNQTYPDFSQADIYEPNGYYLVRKEVPAFADNFTKVWGSHTVKMGGFEMDVSNLQGDDNDYLNGEIESTSGQSTNAVTGIMTGSQQNPTANFAIGSATSYQESSSEPISDMAYQNLSFYVDDTWRAAKRLTLDFGLRFEHIGHWYDRQGTGMADFFPDRVQTDYYAGKADPGFYWHGIDPGVPLSGQPNRLAMVSPRFGLSYDLFGNGNTVIRGGWGAYRFADQYNNYAAALTTAQGIKNYNLPGNTSVLLSQLSSLATSSCPTTGITAYESACASGSHTGLNANDYGVPLTYSYNLTIDKQLKWNSMLEVAYVGSRSSHIIDDGETIEGSNFGAVADQNKTPIDSLFKADSRTGIISNNPENVGTNTNGTATGNVLADYHPYGYAYGTSSIYMPQTTSYTNYNGAQASWMKRAGNLNFNVNATWSKTLGTGLQENPFNIKANYGVEAIDRPWVFNASYQYSTGEFFHRGNSIIRGAVNGWTISGISTWQAGGNLLPNLGNGVPNFNMTLNYINIPSTVTGVTNSVSYKTYYGTDAPYYIQPVLTCNPNKGLGYLQRLQLKCFSAPAVGNYGGQNYPYMSMASYFDNDLALYKTFRLPKEEVVQFRVSAFNWLNHSLPQFTGESQITPYFNVDYNSKAITSNLCSGSNTSGCTVSNFGYLNEREGGTSARIIELDLKYSF